MQWIATAETACAEWRVNDVAPLRAPRSLLGTKPPPNFNAENMADEIIFVKALQDEDDAPRALIVRPKVEGVVVPLIHRELRSAVGKGLVGLHRIVDDDEVGIAPGQDSSHRGRRRVPLPRGYELLDRLFLGRQPRGERLAGTLLALLASRNSG